MTAKRLHLLAGLLTLLIFACSGDPELRPIDSAVSEIISRLDDQGITTIQSSLTFAGDRCLDEYEDDLHVFLPQSEGRIDLYPFADEAAAMVVASEIPSDAACQPIGEHVDLTVRGPYFLCGKVIAFVGAAQSETFVEMCGPPFAVTPVMKRFEEAFEIVPSAVPISPPN